jgi:hypothetical protein
MEALDEIINVTKRPCLLAVAEDRQVTPEKCLNDETRHDTSIIWVCPRPISIEYSSNFYLDVVLPVVIEKQSLRTPFTLVIASSRANWIDITPVALVLWVNTRISINLTGGSLEDFGL